MTSEARSVVTLIEERYGAYEGEEGNIVGAYLSGRFDPSRLGEALDAIRLECPIRYGPPDVATVKRAIETYETENATSLRRKTGTSRSAPEPEPITPEDEAQLLEMAERAGIDTTKEGWMSRFLGLKLRELARAKRIELARVR